MGGFTKTCTSAEEDCPEVSVTFRTNVYIPSSKFDSWRYGVRVFYNEWTNFITCFCEKICNINKHENNLLICTVTTIYHITKRYTKRTENIIMQERKGKKDLATITAWGRYCKS